jgi:hypothetical protein
LLAAFDRWRGGDAQSGSNNMAERATTGKSDHTGGVAHPGPVIDVTPEPDIAAKSTGTARGGRLVLTLLLLAIVLVVAAIAARPLWQDFIAESPAPPASDRADGELAALRAQLTQALDRVAQSERRANTLETRLAALDAEIAALKTTARQPAPDERVASALARLTALEADIKALPRGTGELPSDAAERLTRLEAALKAAPSVDPTALAQLRALAERAGAEQARLAERLALVEANRTAAQDGSRRAAALTLAIGQLGQALRGSTPFQAEFDAVAAFADATVAQALDPLRAPAGNGVATVDQLRQRFSAVASAIKQAEARGTSEGLIGAALARLARVVTIRRIDGADGVDGALARAEKSLADRDLAGALAALAELPEPIKAASQPWLAQAEARLVVEQALARLTQLAATALGAAKP